jgi:hypothetical protein
LISETVRWLGKTEEEEYIGENRRGKNQRQQMVA